MNFEAWKAYAMQRGRVTNTNTQKTGNLVDWMPGKYCKVFIGYGEHVGAFKPPVFETWLKADTIRESNEIPVGGLPEDARERLQAKVREVFPKGNQ